MNTHQADLARPSGVLRALVLASALAGSSALAEGDEPRATPAHVPIEVAFTAGRDLADPSRAVIFDVVFQDPNGGTARVPAFWAGGRTWKVRFASGVLGDHAYRGETAGGGVPGLDGAEGRVRVVAYSGSNPLYRHGPVRVSGDRRHFEHADGTPFFWLGDTWWMGLADRLRWPDEFARLAEDRTKKGFNVVQLVAGLYPDMPAFDPRGATAGGFPWTADYGAIRPEYFDAVDLRIRHLVDAGISPCIVGMWGYYLPWMGDARAKEHWRYLIARYGAMPVTWCVAGEANLPWYLAKGFPFDDREVVHGWTELIRFVRATDPFRRPLTIHPTAINQYTARHATDDPGLLDFDMLQTPHGRREAAVITLKAARDAFAARPTMPVINGEASFERLSDSLPTEWTRAMFWICMTSGAAGHTYGANGIWQNNRKGDPHGKSPTGGTYGTISWDEAMDLPGSAQVAAGKRFLERYHWPSLSPKAEAVAWDGPASGWPASYSRWIWFPEGKATEDAPIAPRYFRKTFEVPTGEVIRQARLRVGADDRFTAWINGRQVGQGGGWLDPEPIEAAGLLKAGPNVLAIRVENLPAPVARNPAGLIAGLEIGLADGRAIQVGSRSDWKANRDEAKDWTLAAFDDSGWSAAVELGEPGIGPWGAMGTGESLPPLCLGSGDETRVCYMLADRPVAVWGLTPGRSYVVEVFDPEAGTSGKPTTITADPSGSARLPAPGLGHDWAAAIRPAP